MKKEDFHIVGAGIGGLTLALGLLQAGQRVHVYERAPALGEIGAGLSLSPNAALGLGHLGMLDFLESDSNIPITQYMFHGETNEQLVAIDRTDVRDVYGAAYYQIHRADFHAELVRRIEALAPGCIELNKSVTSLERGAERTQLHFEDGATVDATIIVGADGIRSAVRDAVFRDCQPEFTGHMAWRGLIPADEVDPILMEEASRVWIAPGRTFVTYPIRKAGLLNVVAFARAPEWVEEGWTVPALPGELKAAFEGYHEMPQAVIDAIPPEDIFRWGLFARKPLDTLISGTIALIGDAAHPMLPWFGQGASSSIEDGIVLARCVADSADIAEAFERYNAARLKRVTFLQAESNLGGERLQGMDPYVLRDQPRQDEDALGIFKYNPATVAI